MYPEVRAAYDDLVPARLAERDFWIKLFQSEHYHQDKAAGRGERAAGGAAQDLFAQYADDARAANRSAADGAPRPRNDRAGPHRGHGARHDALAGALDPLVSLAASVGHTETAIVLFYASVLPPYGASAYSGE